MTDFYRDEASVIQDVSRLISFDTSEQELKPVITRIALCVHREYMDLLEWNKAISDSNAESLLTSPMSSSISKLTLHLPSMKSKTRRPDKPLNQVAYICFSMLHPEMDMSVEVNQKWAKIKYCQMISKLKLYLHSLVAKEVVKVSAAEIVRNELKYCALKRNPIAYEVKEPKAMPVVESSVEELQPFFDFLKLNQGVDNTTEFKRGVVYSDGRMDLCKQVVGPTSIGILMDSLDHNNFIRHFLLGNNIIGNSGAQEIAKHIMGTIETWYLAGNDIGAEGMDALSKAWIEEAEKYSFYTPSSASSIPTTALWLKRNPIKEMGMLHLSKFVGHVNCNLHTLDLDNCGLLDAGIGVLFQALIMNDKSLLKHLYLSANGLTPIGAEFISAYFEHVGKSNVSSSSSVSSLPSLLSSHTRGLNSLWLSVNRLGDEGMVILAKHLNKATSLQRLNVSSNRIESGGARELARAMCTNTTIQVLDLGMYTSTQDLGELPNRICDDGAIQFANMLKVNTTLRVLGVAHNAMSRLGMEALWSATACHPTLVHLEVAERGLKFIDHADSPHVLYKAHRERLESNIKEQYGETTTRNKFFKYHYSILRNPEGVKYISSIYRTRGFQSKEGKNMIKRWDDPRWTTRKPTEKHAPKVSVSSESLESFERSDSSQIPK
ncbi:MAG: hypothetical protein Sylvanvirus11_27 [Sylvanvirus sp.]|uniref:Leucine-rich repeat protein n=1 Tax=Sylvanvirus sp. TaxID=2487774 RepID=A0A3G5AJI1_9VIRU|nr:MAG: hypothetical protein Sylvanvirus11_27 [Sylvanvirus sp.]